MTVLVALYGLAGLIVGIALVTPRRSPTRRVPPVDVADPVPTPGRISTELERAGLPPSPLLLVAISAGLSLVVAAVVDAIFHNPLIALLYAACGLCVPWAYVRLRARDRAQRFAGLMPEWIQAIMREMLANRPIDEAVERTATTGPEDLRPYVRAFAREYRETGDFAAALRRNVRDPLALPEVDIAVEHLVVAQPRGAAEVSADVLKRLAAHLRWVRGEKRRARVEMKRNMKPIYIGMLVPWFALWMFTRPQPEVLTTPGGTLVMLFVAASGILGVWVAKRISRIPLDDRVLVTASAAPTTDATSLPVSAAAKPLVAKGAV